MYKILIYSVYGMSILKSGITKQECIVRQWEGEHWIFKLKNYISLGNLSVNFYTKYNCTGQKNTKQIKTINYIENK